MILMIMAIIYYIIWWTGAMKIWIKQNMFKINLRIPHINSNQYTTPSISRYKTTPGVYLIGCSWGYSSTKGSQ